MNIFESLFSSTAQSDGGDVSGSSSAPVFSNDRTEAVSLSKPVSLAQPSSTSSTVCLPKSDKAGSSKCNRSLSDSVAEQELISEALGQLPKTKRTRNNRNNARPCPLNHSSLPSGYRDRLVRRDALGLGQSVSFVRAVLATDRGRTKGRWISHNSKAPYQQRREAKTDKASHSLRERIVVLKSLCNRKSTNPSARIRQLDDFEQGRISDDLLNKDPYEQKPTKVLVTEVEDDDEDESVTNSSRPESADGHCVGDPEAFTSEVLDAFVLDQQQSASSQLVSSNIVTEWTNEKQNVLANKPKRPKRLTVVLPFTSAARAARNVINPDQLDSVERDKLKQQEDPYNAMPASPRSSRIRDSIDAVLTSKHEPKKKGGYMKFSTATERVETEEWLRALSQICSLPVLTSTNKKEVKKLLATAKTQVEEYSDQIENQRQVMRELMEKQKRLYCSLLELHHTKTVLLQEKNAQKQVLIVQRS